MLSQPLDDMGVCQLLTVFRQAKEKARHFVLHVRVGHSFLRLRGGGEAREAVAQVERLLLLLRSNRVPGRRTRSRSSPSSSLSSFVSVPSPRGDRIASAAAEVATSSFAS
tara:strand:+ start:492 stop:821 length:330 start_codon:yes stop_codon:yes gene_type:complete